MHSYHHSTITLSLTIDQYQINLIIFREAARHLLYDTITSISKYMIMCNNISMQTNSKSRLRWLSFRHIALWSYRGTVTRKLSSVQQTRGKAQERCLHTCFITLKLTVSFVIRCANSTLIARVQLLSALRPQTTEQRIEATARNKSLGLLRRRCWRVIFCVSVRILSHLSWVC